MVNYQFFPRSRGVTKEIKEIIECFEIVDKSKAGSKYTSNEMLGLLRPHLEKIKFRVEHGKKEVIKLMFQFYLVQIIQ